MYVREMQVRYRLRHLDAAYWPVRLNTPAIGAQVVAALLGDEVVEVCVVLCLSVRMELIAYHELSRGTLDTTVVKPRDVFRTALLANAASVVIGHNHPSGHPQPSPEDVRVTRAARRAGELLGIELLDHIIVGSPGRYYSFKESRLLEGE